jgi:hypothetical protein
VPVNSSFKKFKLSRELAPGAAKATENDVMSAPRGPSLGGGEGVIGVEAEKVTPLEILPPPAQNCIPPPEL